MDTMQISSLATFTATGPPQSLELSAMLGNAIALYGLLTADDDLARTLLSRLIPLLSLLHRRMDLYQVALDSRFVLPMAHS